MDNILVINNDNKPKKSRGRPKGSKTVKTLKGAKPNVMQQFRQVTEVVVPNMLQNVEVQEDIAQKIQNVIESNMDSSEKAKLEKQKMKKSLEENQKKVQTFDFLNPVEKQKAKDEALRQKELRKLDLANAKDNRINVAKVQSSAKKARKSNERALAFEDTLVKKVDIFDPSFDPSTLSTSTSATSRAERLARRIEATQKLQEIAKKKALREEGKRILEEQKRKVQEEKLAKEAQKQAKASETIQRLARRVQLREEGKKILDEKRKSNATETIQRLARRVKLREEGKQMQAEQRKIVQNENESLFGSGLSEETYAEKRKALSNLKKRIAGKYKSGDVQKAKDAIALGNLVQAEYELIQKLPNYKAGVTKASTTKAGRIDKRVVGNRASETKGFINKVEKLAISKKKSGRKQLPSNQLFLNTAQALRAQANAPTLEGD